MMPALSLITVAHWAQSGNLSTQHIRGEVTNIFKHKSKDELPLMIVDRFSFQGNTVINITGDAPKGKNSC